MPSIVISMFSATASMSSDEDLKVDSPDAKGPKTGRSGDDRSVRL